MKIYTKFFICLAALFILVILYSTVRTINSQSPIENYEDFYTKFTQLEKHLDSLEPSKYTFPYPIYYINLESDVEKNKFIQDQFEYCQMSDRVHRVTGIDARKSRPTHFRGRSIESNLTLSNPELGCLLSHIKAIVTAYNAGDEYAIILENDAYFKHARLWKTSLDDLVNNAPPDWNILNLYSSSICCGKLFEKDIYVKHSPSTKCYLASSYIINRQGMYNILTSINYLGGSGGSRLPLISTKSFHRNLKLFKDNGNGSSYHGADELLFQWAGNTYFVKPTTFFVYNDSEKMRTSIQSDADLQNQLENAHAVLSQFT